MKRNTAKKNWTMLIAVYLIVFVVLNVVVFLVFKEKNNVFWMSYAFMVVGFGVQIVTMFAALRSMETETVFMGIPLASLSLYYFFAAEFVGLVFMFFHNAPFKLALILQLLILAAYGVVAMLALIGRNTVQDVNDNLRQNVQAVKTLKVDVDVLIPQVHDPALKKALSRVSETVKYSDPMSNTAVEGIEGQIMGAFNTLRVQIENNQNADAVQTCKDIEVLFLQRNNLLKATK